jgi:hypothetical protein
MQTRRPNGMPGGPLVTLPWVFMSSSGFPWSEQTFMFCGKGRGADIAVALRNL